jgi:transposase
MDEIILLAFCNKYLPATNGNFTDIFTSKQIAYIIQEHTGEPVGLKELNTELQKRGYDYDLIENRFSWLCCKNAASATVLSQ